MTNFLLEYGFLFLSRVFWYFLRGFCRLLWFFLKIFSVKFNITTKLIQITSFLLVSHHPTRPLHLVHFCHFSHLHCFLPHFPHCFFPKIVFFKNIKMYIDLYKNFYLNSNLDYFRLNCLVLDEIIRVPITRKNMF